MSRTTMPPACAGPGAGPPPACGAALLDRLWSGWQRGGWAVVLPLLVVAAAASFRGRSWRQLPVEAVLAQEPRALWLLAACVGAVALTALIGRRRRAAAAALVAAALLGALADALQFSAADPSKQTPTFHRRATHDLAPLGAEPGWYNHWRPYRFYAALHDVLRGSRVVSYRPDQRPHESFEGLFHAAYRRYMAEIRVVVVEDYDPGLTNEQYAALRERLSEPYFDIHTLLTWRIVLTPGPLADDYRVMRRGDEHLLVRERLLRELREGG